MKSIRKLMEDLGFDQHRPETAKSLIKNLIADHSTTQVVESSIATPEKNLDEVQLHFEDWLDTKVS